MRFYILKHIYNHFVGAAVFRAFKRPKRRYNRRICIRSGRRYDMSSKGWIVSSSMLRMQYKRHIENLRLCLGIRLVYPEKLKYSLCGRKLWFGRIYMKSHAVMIIFICNIIIAYKHRKLCNKLYGLTKNIRQACVVGAVIIWIKCKYGAGKCIHNIAARFFHYYVAHKILRNTPVIPDYTVKAVKLTSARKLSEKKKIHRFLKTKAAFRNKSVYKVLNINSTIIKFSVARN